MLLKTWTDCLALSLCMLILTIQVVKLHFTGASQKSMPFLLWLEYLLGILLASYQSIVLNTCQIWESCNNFNQIKRVTIVCCVFNGTQCKFGVWLFLFWIAFVQDNQMSHLWQPAPSPLQRQQSLNIWNCLANEILVTFAKAITFDLCLCVFIYNQPRQSRTGFQKWDIKIIGFLLLSNPFSS